ncbi:hypothetical protein BDP27DRAFT_1423011 [Rhodocollybia butyracea]|uniref:Uncharacterized protein n=1 Tax=Rhodocollybia butyracea TaxID=206335 RepID=A0A9P5U6Y0_9AGAR|nr:hypothetical protein BDP27DRAFT_1423011 [Rhodocollybia butyracea]
MESKDRYADYVTSEDTDVLRYEAPIIRDITSQQRPLIIISGAELRSMPMLSLTHSSLDFTQRIRNLRHSDALGFIRAHSIEKFIEAETKFKPKLPREGKETLPLVPEDPTMWFRGDEE